MKALDLCAGIGGFRMGLTRVGVETVGWAEIDRDAQRAYRSIYDTEGEFFHADVMGTDAFSPLIGKVDIVTSGFPCQPYSQIGKQKGLQDPRGGVIFGIEKICELIKPRWILLENVPEVLTNDRGRAWAKILSGLARLGDRVEWQVLNAKDFGVPQNRRRCYVLIHSGAPIFPIEVAENPAKIETVAKHRVKGAEDIDGFQRFKLYSADGILPTVCKSAYINVVNIYFPETGKVRAPTPRETWRLQGFPDSAFDAVAAWCKSTQKLQGFAGNAVCPNVIEAIGRRIVEAER